MASCSGGKELLPKPSLSVQSQHDEVLGQSLITCDGELREGAFPPSAGWSRKCAFEERCLAGRYRGDDKGIDVAGCRGVIRVCVCGCLHCCQCVSVCVSVCQRERERERENICIQSFMITFVSS